MKSLKNKDACKYAKIPRKKNPFVYMYKKKHNERQNRILKE